MGIRTPLRVARWLSAALLLLFGGRLDVASAQGPCELVGFWRPEDATGRVGFQDFNEEQVLVMRGGDSLCRIVSYADYTTDRDSLYLDIAVTGQRVQLLYYQPVCDSLYLINLTSQKQPVDTLAFERLAGNPCDRATNYRKRPPFFRRPAVRRIFLIGFWPVYLGLLALYIFHFFRGSRVRYYRYWYMLVGWCFLFIRFEYIILLLFAFHSGTLLVHLLRRQGVINVIGRACLYGVYAGVVSLLEYFVRFGVEDFATNVAYFTAVPVLLNLIGLLLVYDVIRMAYTLGYSSFWRNLLIGFLLMYAPQLYLWFKGAEVLSFLERHLPDWLL